MSGEVDYCFGLVLYGIPNPESQQSTTIVLYTDRKIDNGTLPSELTGATILPIIDKRPGIHWGADPREPVSAGEEMTVTLHDDSVGTLGTLFLQDSEADFWGINVNRIGVGTTTATITGSPIPANGLYYLENEAVGVTVTASTASATPTHNLTLTRGLLGSTACTHFLRPSRYSAGEPGNNDRIFLHSKPQWEEGFYCGVYLFQLDQYGAIARYVLRRGVVAGEPLNEYPLYHIKVRLLEDRINAHQVGETSKEVTLTHKILVTDIEQGRPKQVEIQLEVGQAEAFFNEPLIPRGDLILSATSVADLLSRMQEDPDLWWQVAVHDEDDWVYKINSIAIRTPSGIQGQVIKRLALLCTLEPKGYTPGATIIAGEETTDLGLFGTGTVTTGYNFKDWWTNSLSGSEANEYNSGTVEGAPPTITLRFVMQKPVVKALLILACSMDGSSNGTYDKLIGGIGAGIPEAYFSLGAQASNPLSIAGSTSQLLQLDQLLGPVNTYLFDVTEGVSLRDFLTNEFIATQSFLCPLQTGLLTLKLWNHAEPAVATLEPVPELVPPGIRLRNVKRLDLSSGINWVSMEPTQRRSVRWLGTVNIQDNQVQPVRFHREGLNLSVTDIQSGDLGSLIRSFYKLFGGSVTVYEVQIPIGDFMEDGIEPGDGVTWSDTTVPTPTGLGISGLFFVVGVDLNYDLGRARLKLLKNTLATPRQLLQSGLITPILDVVNVTRLSSTQVQVQVMPLGLSSFDPDTDFGSLYNDIQGEGGYLQCNNFLQAPVGDIENKGSLEAHALLDSYSFDGTTALFVLRVASGYLRGPAQDVIDLFVVGETRIAIPSRSESTQNHAGVLIEATAVASPTNQAFTSFQPQAPLNGRLYTFGE